MFYRVCPKCGAHLDPNERCDCGKEKEKQDNIKIPLFVEEQGTGQLEFNWVREWKNLQRRWG